MAQHPTLGFLLSDVSRLLRRAFEAEIEGSGLTLAQARALIRLRRCEGARQVDLADQLEVRPITLARLIDQLEADGLVERRVDEHDRRAYRLFLTDAAEPMLSKIGEVGARLHKRALKGLDAATVSAAMQTLELMRDNLGSR